MGAGKVGQEVIRLLVQRRAVVIAADVNHDKAEAAARTGASRLIDPSDALGATADILCPCALGGLLTEDEVPDLHCAIIVGGANNQLASVQVADSLAADGILYVPDFLANAGGIINIAEEAHGYDRAAVKAVGQIRDTTTLVLERAKAQGITPLAAAEELVAKRLARARDNGGHWHRIVRWRKSFATGCTARSETEDSQASIATLHNVIGVRARLTSVGAPMSPSVTGMGGARSWGCLGWSTTRQRLSTGLSARPAPGSTREQSPKGFAHPLPSAMSLAS